MPWHDKDKSYMPWHDKDKSYMPWHDKDKSYISWHDKDKSYMPWHDQDKSYMPWHDQDKSYMPWHDQDKGSCHGMTSVLTRKEPQRRSKEFVACPATREAKNRTATSGNPTGMGTACLGLTH